MRKFLLSVEDVDRPERIVNNTGNIKALILLSKSINLSDFVSRELDVGEVFDDAGCGD